ncbi:unnamed protein product [Bursaphelenchus xylophilus]|uniref:(pine wood nematode) hypothetical protein n=1 Tax=Bursaphelenchus xylophilus TaxID=6326 RepID=A0A1I7SQV0_BURXY|nr:unnamed protein product [Bursaphelenchus xylophilus]CAG9110428.1 unnamed protein product [Bursaphelenchus xylophilus]
MSADDAFTPFLPRDGDELVNPQAPENIQPREEILTKLQELLSKCPTTTLHQLNEVSRQCNDIHLGTWLSRITCTFVGRPQHLPPAPTPPTLYTAPSKTSGRINT